MKHIIYAVMLLLGLSIIGCQKEEPKPEPKPQPEEKATLTVAPTSLTFENTGDSQSISITTNKAWTISSSQSWCKVSQSSGNATGSSAVNITVTCEENTTYDERTCTLTIKAGTASQTVEVKQGEGLGLVISQTTYDVSNEAQSIEVEVKANVEYEYAIAEDAKDWITVSETKSLVSSKVKFDIAANESYDEREGVITFKQKGGVLTGTVTVKQSAEGGLIITQTEYDLSNEAQSIEVEVKANVEYEYTIAEDAKEWITVSETKALVSSKVKFDIAANESYDEREGVITFKQKDGPLAGTVTVKQGEEKGLIITKTSYELSDKEQTIEVEVKANVEYEYHIAEDAIDWITPVETKALVPSKVMFSIAANETYDSRSAEITIKSSDGSMSESVTVTQMQKGAIIVAKDLYEFDRSGGELTVEVNHSIEFDVETSGAWIAEVTTKALTTTTETFFIAKNDSGKEREGAITFKSKDGAVSQCIIIKQGIVTTIVTSEKSIIFENCGGSASVEINPNVNFDFDVVYPDNTDYDKLGWISGSSIREPRIHLNIDANTSYDRRRALLIVKDVETEELDTVKIFVKQQEYLEAETTVYELPYTGGDCIIHFNSSYDYEIEIPESAIWLKRVDTKAIQSHTVTLYAEENEDDSSRETVVKVSLQDGTLYKNITIKQYGKVYRGNYIVDSEEDALFLNKCAFTAIDGDLTIKDIPSAASMNNIIEEISGSLYLYCQYPQGMSNFDGLYGLKHVVGDVIIQGDTWKLMSTEGLNNLNKIDGSLNIHGQYDKNAFKGLIGLTSIGGNLTISASSSYRITVPFTGLNNLLSVGGDISISNADDLTGLELTKVNNLTLSNVNSFTGLSRLHEISGNLEITGDSTADSFAGFDNLEIIGGNFYISARADRGNVFSNISSFSGFSKLRQIGGNFEIYANIYGWGSAFPNITSLDGFESLTKVNGNFLLHSRMQETDNGGIGKIYILPKLSEINIPALQEIGGNLEIKNTIQNRSIAEYCYGIDYKNVTFDNLEKIGGNFICSDHAEDTYWTGYKNHLLCKAPPKLKCLAGLSANMAFSSINDGFLSLTEIDNLTLTKENCLGFPAIETINKGLKIERPGEDFKMDKLKTIGGDLDIYIDYEYGHNELSIMQSLETIGGSFNLELSTMQDQVVNKITGFTNLSSVKSISVSNFTKVDDFRVFVNAVKNGSSWICSGCAFNPTQTQMRNGIYKED